MGGGRNDRSRGSFASEMVDKSAGEMAQAERRLRVARLLALGALRAVQAGERAAEDEPEEEPDVVEGD